MQVTKTTVSAMYGIKSLISDANSLPDGFLLFFDQQYKLLLANL